MMKGVKRFILLFFVILFGFISTGCEINETGERLSSDDGLSSNNLLRSLAVSEGTFKYPFNPHDWIQYVSVDNSVESISVTPFADHNRATITVNGATIESGRSSRPIDLEVGDNNKIEITVSAQDEKGNTYSLYVTRHSENYSNAKLAELAVHSHLGDIDLTPAFDPLDSNRSFTALVQVDNISITAIAESAYEGAEVTAAINGAPADLGGIDLSIGANNIAVTVTAPDNSTKEIYDITLIYQTPDATNSNLAVLEIVDVDFNQDFNPGETDYTANVPASINPITIITITEGVNSTVTINGEDVVNNSHSVNLNPGNNNIEIVVQSGDTVSTTYNITATLLQGSSNANMSNILVTMGPGNTERPLYPGNFDRTSPNYHDKSTVATDFTVNNEYSTVIYAFDSITLTATAEATHINTMEYQVNGGGWNDCGDVDGVASIDVSLVKGEVAVINIRLTAEDETTQKTYTVYAKLLNIHEYYWGIYGPAMTASFDKWGDPPINGLIGYTKEIDGEESGLLTWSIKVQGVSGINTMIMENYNDGRDIPNENGTIITVIDYNENGFTVDGTLSSVLSSSGSGIQEGSYNITTLDPWGDSVCTLDYHLVIVDKEKVVDPDSYTTITYMGETVSMLYRGSNSPYPFTDTYDWTTGWESPANSVR